MKRLFLRSCIQCNKKTNIINKKILGMVLILIPIPYVIMFGIYASTIIFSLMFISTGLYWMIKDKSKDVLCDDCKSIVSNHK